MLEGNEVNIYLCDRHFLLDMAGQRKTNEISNLNR
jgi:hypothetical protein